MSLDPKDPAHSLAKLYHLIWIITIAVLTVSAVVIIAPASMGLLYSFRETFPNLAVQTYLILVPAAIFVFSVIMFFKKNWSMALSGTALTLIWAISKVLG